MPLCLLPEMLVAKLCNPYYALVYKFVMPLYSLAGELQQQQMVNLHEPDLWDHTLIDFFQCALLHETVKGQFTPSMDCPQTRICLFFVRSTILMVLQRRPINLDGNNDRWYDCKNIEEGFMIKL
ncbi:hypothetical protein MUK42_06218 [Musa troglodytarum]|uniref:Uncharacterized protein n=1 Tax=Musa troglodytarum TaxID=320322 RepID=A0A9E7KJY6_9LILI|nr:hypothetical protein MUK42_06218 [Musa troglodytarum]